MIEKHRDIRRGARQPPHALHPGSDWPPAFRDTSNMGPNFSMQDSWRRDVWRQRFVRTKANRASKPHSGSKLGRLTLRGAGTQVLTTADRVIVRASHCSVQSGSSGLPFLPLLALWPSKSVMVNGWNGRPIRNGKYPQCDIEPAFYCSILIAISDVIGARAANQDHNTSITA